MRSHAHLRAGWMAALVVLAVVAGTLLARHWLGRAHPTAADGDTRVGASSSLPTHLPKPNGPRYVGIYEHGVPDSFLPVARFSTLTGTHPNLVLYYSGWWKPFPLAFANEVRAAGAIPFAQLMPIGSSVSVPRVLAGDYDNYLTRFAAEVRQYGHPVVLSFAPEANGHWYPWGWTRGSPGVWVAAWRHVVRLFRQAGAHNVTWLWTMDRLGTANKSKIPNGPLRDYWPGQRYVDWVGLDGYFEFPTDTFRSVFGPTIQAARRLTDRPILIAETAVGPMTGNRPGDIRALFVGLAHYHLLGMVWFDKSQGGGVYHQNWSIEGFGSAERAFHQGSVAFLGS